MENQRTVAVYRHKALEELTAKDINEGVYELKCVAKAEGYESVTDIDVQEAAVDGRPAAEFIGKPY